MPLAALLECVAVSAPRYFLDTRAHVCGGYGTPPPAKNGRRRFQVGQAGCCGSNERLRCWLQPCILSLAAKSAGIAVAAARQHQVPCMLCLL